MLHLLVLSLLNFAHAKKTSTPSETTSTVTETTPAKKTEAKNIPKDATSKAFAARLLETTGRGFSPNTMGLTYSQLTFSADNTWSAKAEVSVMDESMDCVEKGTWSMDPASEENKANMSWTITSTDCPSRVAPIEMRLELVLTGTEAGVHANFR